MVLFFTYSLLFGLGSSCTFSAGLVVIGQYFKKRQSLANGVLQQGTAEECLLRPHVRGPCENYRYVGKRLIA